MASHPPERPDASAAEVSRLGQIAPIASTVVLFVAAVSAIVMLRSAPKPESSGNPIAPQAPTRPPPPAATPSLDVAASRDALESLRIAEANVAIASENLARADEKVRRLEAELTAVLAKKAAADRAKAEADAAAAAKSNGPVPTAPPPLK